jgi:hypothetical protein
MPVIHVRALPPSGGVAQVDRALQAIATDVAEAIGGEPSGTWCTFNPVERMTAGTHAVLGEGRIVYLDLWLRSRGAELDGRSLTAACLAAARGFEVPLEDIWGTLRPVEPGHVFAGGSLIEG